MTTTPTTTTPTTAKPSGSSIPEVTLIIEAIVMLVSETEPTTAPADSVKAFDDGLRSLLGNHGGAIWGTQWTLAQAALRSLKPYVLALPKPAPAKRGPKPKAALVVEIEDGSTEVLN